MGLIILSPKGPEQGVVRMNKMKEASIQFLRRFGRRRSL